MSSTVLEKLSQALKKIDRPGSFCVEGDVPAILPGLEVEDLGPIGLPLTDKQAKDLKRHCEQAPHGQGTKTVVDPKVRRVWRMGPERFTLTNPDWNRLLKEIVGKVQAGLGLERQKLEGHLYELLLYEPGDFFLPHRDGEKLDRMVATLVVVLPSTYEGGELIVRHDGQERIIDFGSKESRPFHIPYAAFYADCEHELRPVRSGHRLCLVYNLTLSKSKKPIKAPRDSEHLERIRPLVQKWASDDEAGKLVITLDHQYTQDGIGWDALKGADRAKARVLRDAAREAGCQASLSLLTFWESGSAEYSGGGGYGYRRRRSWYNDYGDEDDPSLYEMGEIFDSSLTAKHWIDSEGNPLSIGELNVEKEELLDPDALTSVTPEEEFEGYTGNAGMTLERWYRHAAVVLWPERKYFEIICDQDSRNVLPVLHQMITRWKQAPAGDAEAVKAECLDLARAILKKWPENRFVYSYAHLKKPETGTLLKALNALDEPELFRLYLGEVLVKDVTIEPDQSLVSICQRHGWETFQPELLTVMRGTNTETVGRNVRLLERICLSKPKTPKGWSDLCRSLAQEFVSNLETMDREANPNDWRLRSVPRAEVLEGLARALIASEQFEPLSRVVSHALAFPALYPLSSAHLPALSSLRTWVEKHLKQPCPPLAEWAAACRSELEALTAEAPREPTDFRRASNLGCTCADCKDLKRFLEDPNESEYRFRARQDRRDHLERRIQDSRCDLNLATERRGSPHTLVCTKNKASYLERLRTYQQNLEHLSTVRAIEANVSKSMSHSPTEPN